MKFRYLQILVLIILSFSSCKDEEPENIWDEENLFIRYGDNEFLPSGSFLYLYDQVDDAFYYSLMCSETNFFSFGFEIEDIYSKGDFVKLNFIGDTITTLYGTYPIIADSNSFIIFDFNDSTGTYSQKEYIANGLVSIISNDNLFGENVRFEGKTQNGKSILFNSKLTGFAVNELLSRKVLGIFELQGISYDLSIIYTSRDDDIFMIKLGDIDVEKSVRTELTLTLRTDNNVLEGVYNGSNIDEINIFHGDLKIYNLEGERLHYRFFNGGELKISKIIDEHYKLEYNISTSDNDSVVGNWESFIEFHN